MIIKKENGLIERRFVATEDNIPLPTASTEYSAGYDIKTRFPIVLEPNEEIEFNTHLRYETTESNEFIAIYPRSGLGFKNYVRLANTVGIIDSDYEGEIKIKLRNESDKTVLIEEYTGIAQAIIQPYLKLSPDKRVGKKRGKGGFGSTDE